MWDPILIDPKCFAANYSHQLTNQCNTPAWIYLFIFYFLSHITKINYETCGLFLKDFMYMP